MPYSPGERENASAQKYYYTLLISEHLPANWSEEFEGLSVTCTSTGETQISGFLPDQSALHGLLTRIRDLNLTLISVNRIATNKLPKTESRNTQSK